MDTAVEICFARSNRFSFLKVSLSMERTPSLALQMVDILSSNTFDTANKLF